MYVVGADRWRTADSWPLPGAELTRFHLQAGAARSRQAAGGSVVGPPGDEPPDRFIYDPDAPVTYWLDRSLWDLAAAAR